MISFVLNDENVELEADPEMPLLWALREYFNLTGAKYGCGQSLCGACTVHLNGVAVRACSIPLQQVVGAKVRTIEGLSKPNEPALHPVQQAWIEHNVPQCGYCQSGQIMTAVALLEKNAHPSEAQIRAGMAGNLCRCGTYPRIVSAMRQLAGLSCEPNSQQQDKAVADQCETEANGDR